MPDDGARNPPIMWMSVDFPAPFGPSSPVTPGPTFIETSLTATTLPYQRETFSSTSSHDAPRGDDPPHPPVASLHARPAFRNLR